MRYEGNKVIITESELHDLVNESVKLYLREMDEGILGGLKNLGQKAGEAMQAGYNNAKTAVNNQVRKAGEAMQAGYNNAKTAVNNQVNNVKTAYQQGSAQQDLQRVNASLKPMVAKGILSQGSYNQILRYLNSAIQKQGGQAMQGIEQ